MSTNYTYLSQFIGKSIERIGLLVWPDAEGLRETDSQLHIEVEAAVGTVREFTCSTASDGQTPQVEFEEWSHGIPYSKLKDRMKVWATSEFWNSPKGQSYELFETGDERVYGVGKNSIITAVFVVQFADAAADPTGLVIEFDNKTQIWSGPSSITGNFVSANPEDFEWPSKIELVSII